MSDLIDRQAAIEALDGEITVTGRANAEAVRGYARLVADRLKRLPPAQPERPKGKWMPHIERSREYIGTALVNVRYDYWLCDTCGYQVENGQPTYNYCPNCGADMRGEQDG